MVGLNEELPLLLEEEIEKYHLTQASDLKIAKLMTQMGRLEQDNKYEVSLEMLTPPPKSAKFIGQTPVTNFTLGEKEEARKPEAKVEEVPTKKEPTVLGLARTRPTEEVKDTPQAKKSEVTPIVTPTTEVDIHALRFSDYNTHRTALIGKKKELEDKMQKQIVESNRLLNDMRGTATLILKTKTKLNRLQSQEMEFIRSRERSMTLFANLDPEGREKFEKMIQEHLRKTKKTEARIVAKTADAKMTPVETLVIETPEKPNTATEPVPE